MNIGHSIHTLNYFSSQLSHIRQTFVKQPGKLFRNPIARFSNGTNRMLFKVKRSPAIVENASNGELPNQISNLWKPIAFTATFTIGGLVGISIWQYESFAPERSYHKWLQQKFMQLKTNINNKPSEIKMLCTKLSSFEKTFTEICALNLIVFGLWRVHRFQPFMLKYFCSNPVAKAACWPMLLSTFSHYSPLHIFANMCVLHSFSNIAISGMGQHQFLYLYLCGGVISSLSSYVFKTAVAIPGVSLGASGAIMAILAFVCVQYPDTQLDVLFVPMFTFSAGAAIKVLIGVDLAGCILGWKFFDHAAHLGGALTGLFWYFVGLNYIWPKRLDIQKYWHQITTTDR